MTHQIPAGVFWGIPSVIGNGCVIDPVQFKKEIAELEAGGTPIGPHDTLIAATALRHQAILVTRNEREFSRVAGLQWVNWHPQ